MKIFYFNWSLSFSVPVSGQLILQNGYSLQSLHLLLHEQGFQTGLHCGHAQVRSQKQFPLFALSLKESPLQQEKIILLPPTDSLILVMSSVKFFSDEERTLH